LLLAAIALVMLPRLYVVSASYQVPLPADAWIYLADSLRIIEAEGIPAEISQWGLGGLPFPPDKLSLQVFTAACMLLADLDYIQAAIVMTLGTTLISVAAVWFFARHLLEPGMALLLTLCVFFDAPYEVALFMLRFGVTFYRSESFALMLGFLALWLTYVALFKGQRALLVWVVFLLAMTFTSHGITALVVAVLIGGAYLGKWLVEGHVDRRQLRELAYTGAGALVMVLAYYAVVGTLPLYSQGLADTQSFDTSGDLDPTVEFRVMMSGLQPPYAQARPKSEHRFYLPPVELWQELNKQAFPEPWGLDKTSVLVWAFLALPVLLLLARGTSKRFKIHALPFLCLYVAIYTVGLLFSYRYETYSPALVQPIRLFQYARLSVFAWGGLYLQAALDAGRKWVSSRKWKSARVLRAAFGALVYLLAVTVVLTVFMDRGLALFEAAPRRSNLDADGVQALEWLQENTTREDLVLTNARTGASFDIVADRENLLEGRGAYARADIVGRVLELGEMTSQFYQNPFQVDPLEAYGIDYVILAPPRSIGGVRDFAPDRKPALFEIAPHLIKSAGFGPISIYKVDTASLEELGSLQAETVAGFGYLGAHKLMQARQSFESAIAGQPEERSPNRAWAHIGLALVAEEAGDADPAWAEYERALQLSDRYALPYERLAGMAAARGEWARAAELYSRAAALQPHGRTYLEWARALRESGQLEAAREQFERARGEDTVARAAEVGWQETVGDLYLSEGSLTQALTAYRRASEMLREDLALSVIPVKGRDDAPDGLVSVYDLLDADLFEAAVKVPLRPEMVRRSIFIIHHDPRLILYQHPAHSISYRLEVPLQARMRFGVALSPEVWQVGKGDGVLFEIRVETDEGRWRIFDEYIDPKNVLADRRWHDYELPLDPWAGYAVTLTFSTTPGPNGNDHYDWAGWGAPRIVQPAAPGPNGEAQPD
jgi:tetratricopeptide (TPR) repeat protein